MEFCLLYLICNTSNGENKIMKYDDLFYEEMKSQMDKILQTLENIKDKTINKVYNTEELCEYLGVGKSVINSYKKNGDLPYSKIGRTFLFTQDDVNHLIKNNKVIYV